MFRFPLLDRPIFEGKKKNHFENKQDTDKQTTIPNVPRYFFLFINLLLSVCFVITWKWSISIA